MQLILVVFVGRSINECRSTPARLCKTRYNTTAPMYGVSLTSGQPVTIVQKFPDLLQQVVFEVCEWVFFLLWSTDQICIFEGGSDTSNWLTVSENIYSNNYETYQPS